MAHSLQTLLPAVVRLAEQAGRAPLSDVELLRRFTAAGDPAAFEALVKRHAGMVLGVCVRVLGRGGDADDAFQATWLALVRRAASIRTESVAGWLYRVARRASVRAARRRSQRAARECSAARPEAVVSDEVERADWRARLDREVERLPARFREAFVLCHLEERPHDEAARELGCPLGTLHSRLARAKTRLRERLGVVPAALGCTVPASQVRAAVRFAGGSTAPSAVVALSQGVWSPMTMFPIKSVAAMVLATVAAGAGVVAFNQPTATATPTQATPRGEPTLDELKRENERLRREVAGLKLQLAAYETITARSPAEPPSDQEVVRAMSRPAPRGGGETYRDEIAIAKNCTADRLDPPRFYPLVGLARLRRMTWDCIVICNETVRGTDPAVAPRTQRMAHRVIIEKSELLTGAGGK